MTTYERLRYEMFVRVRDFGKAHREEFPESSIGGKTFDAVAEVVAQIEANAAAKLLAAQEGKRQKAAARDAVQRRLTAVARTARVAARREPDTDKVFQLPKRTSDVALLTAARAFIREGEAASGRLVRLGLPADFVSDLQQRVDELEQAIHGRREGKIELAAAQAAIDKAMAQGLDLVRELDMLVVNTVGSDPILLATWKRERRVHKQPAAPQVPAAASDEVTADVAEHALQKAS